MSAEGVPVATCPDYEVHVDRMVREGRIGFNDLVRLGEGAWGDGYIAGSRSTHPAAASAESIRAEVIEECAKVADEVARRLDANPDMGYSAELCARLIRALSARATKEV